jgi:hypothetical protein
MIQPSPQVPATGLPTTLTGGPEPHALAGHPVPGAGDRLARPDLEGALHRGPDAQGLPRARPPPWEALERPLAAWPVLSRLIGRGRRSARPWAVQARDDRDASPVARRGGRAVARRRGPNPPQIRSSFVTRSYQRRHEHNARRNGWRATRRRCRPQDLREETQGDRGAGGASGSNGRRRPGSTRRRSRSW